MMALRKKGPPTGALFARTAALFLAACGACTPATPATTSPSPSSAPVDPAPGVSSVASVPSAPSPAPAVVASGDAGDGGVALDIIYVPTPQKVVEKMLEVAHVTRTDVVYDLGCGDGRIVVTAARKMGAHGIGFPDAADGVSGKTNRHLPGYVPPYASRE
jgi:hypothetical protein